MACEIVQQLQSLLWKPDNYCLIPGIQVKKEGENICHRIILWPSHEIKGVHILTLCTNTQ